MGNRIHKLAAYADDLISLLTNPSISLPCLLKELTEYGEVSGFRVNMAKSEAMNINLSIAEAEGLKQNFPFGWVKQAITYLGTRIPANLKDLFSLNFPQ